MSRRAPAVSILASQGNGTLYIGVTSNLAPRIWLHRQGTEEGFARQSAMHGYPVLPYCWYCLRLHARRAALSFLGDC